MAAGNEVVRSAPAGKKTFVKNLRWLEIDRSGIVTSLACLKRPNGSAIRAPKSIARLTLLLRRYKDAGESQ